MIKLILPVITVLFLVACGGGDEKENGGNNTTAPKTKSQAKAAPKGGNTGVPVGEEPNTKRVPSRRRSNPTSPPSLSKEQNVATKTTGPPVQKVDGSKSGVADSNVTATVKANGESPKSTDLIGSWTTTTGEFTYILQLQKNSIGKVTITKDKVAINRDFKWEVDGTKYLQTGKDEVNDGKITVDSGIFAIDGDILSLTFEGEEHKLERVKVASAPSTPSRQPVRPGQGATNRPGQGRPSGGRPGGGFGARSNPFAQLDLNEDQQKKLDVARDEMSAQLRGLFTDRDTPREERTAKMQEVRDAYEAHVKTTLTPEQYTKYQESRSRTGQGARGSGGSGGRGQGGFGGRRPR